MSTREIAESARIAADHSQDPDVWQRAATIELGEAIRRTLSSRCRRSGGGMMQHATQPTRRPSAYFPRFVRLFRIVLSLADRRAFSPADLKPETEVSPSNTSDLIFSDPQLVRGMFNAIAIAAVVTLLCLCISLPLAVLGVRFEFPGRGILGGLMLAPLVLPPFVGAIGVRLLLGRLGPLTVLLGMGHGAGFDWLGRFRAIGIVLVEALHLYPVLLLNLQASLASVDPSMEQAAANLGASRFTVFRRITLPLIRPGIFAGCTLTMIWSFTELGTPLMFGFYTITPVQIFEQITDVADNPLPFALVVVTLGVAVGLYRDWKGAAGAVVRCGRDEGVGGADAATFARVASRGGVSAVSCWSWRWRCSRIFR